MKKLLLLALLCLPIGLHAQQGGIVLGAQATTTCSAPSNAVAVVAISGNQGGASFTVTANASGNTISFFASGDNQTSWTALNVTASNSQSPVTTTTGTGTFQANVAGYTHVCMEISTLVSGTTTVSIRPASASARAGGGSGLSFVASVPATCTPGVTASVELNAAPGTIYYCDATNHWTASYSGAGAAAFCINLYVSGGYPNGNFYGECAPASMAASLQYTEVTADGTAGQAKVTDGAQHYKFLSFASGISNFNQTIQSQVVVSGTEYYLTRSDLDMPAVYTQAIAAGTTMTWRIALTKTAAGTGTFQINIKKGTAGSIADTSVVTQTIGTQTAAADNMECDIQLTWTSATAAYWTMIPHQAAATGTGFGLVYPATAAQFSGTISGQTTTTASDKYGLSVIFTTGTPTFVVNYVKAQAFGVN